MRNSDSLKLPLDLCRWVGGVVLASTLTLPPRAEAQGGCIGFCIGETLGKESDRPASFSLIKTDTAWVWRADGVAHYRDGIRGMIYDVGVQATLGTAQKEGARVFWPIATLAHDVGGVYWEGSLRYESTTDYAWKKGVAGLRVSPTAIPSIGLGIPLGRNPEFRWRIYAGAQQGWAFADKDTVEVPEGGAFTRGVATLETLLAVKRSSAPDAASLFELTGSADSWYLNRAGEFKRRVALTLGVPVSATVWVQLKYDQSEKPPSFVGDDTFTLAVGVRK